MKYKKLTQDEVRLIETAIYAGWTVDAICKIYGCGKSKVYEIKKNMDYVSHTTHTDVTGVTSDTNDRILVISDEHNPYSHTDKISFLEAVKEKYNPTRVINTGDEVDNHYLNFHTKESKILNPTGEKQAAIEALQEMEKLFPKMDLLYSNHGDLTYRKAQAIGLLPDDIKDRKDRLHITADWTWYDNLEIELPTGSICYFTHDYSANVLNGSQKLGMSLVQGHFHTRYSLSYWSTPRHLHFALQMPCLIDTHSPAFNYINKFKGRILVGCAMIIDGMPKLIPLVKDRHGRWNGKVN